MSVEYNQAGRQVFAAKVHTDPVIYQEGNFDFRSKLWVQDQAMKPMIDLLMCVVFRMPVPGSLPVCNRIFFLAILNSA